MIVKWKCASKRHPPGFPFSLLALGGSLFSLRFPPSSLNLLSSLNWFYRCKNTISPRIELGPLHSLNMMSQGAVGLSTIEMRVVIFRSRNHCAKYIRISNATFWLCVLLGQSPRKRYSSMAAHEFGTFMGPLPKRSKPEPL